MSMKDDSPEYEYWFMGFSLLSASEFLQTEKWRCAKQ